MGGVADRAPSNPPGLDLSLGAGCPPSDPLRLFLTTTETSFVAPRILEWMLRTTKWAMGSAEMHEPSAV